MNRPFIGITTGQKQAFQNEQFAGAGVSYCMSDLAQAVLKAGAVPVLITDHSPDETATYIEAIDALILAGGPDVNPFLYGQEIKASCGEIDFKRDQREYRLIQAAIDKQLPILGICRGMQLMNVYLGGSLLQDLTVLGPAYQDHNQIDQINQAVHPIKIEAGSKWSRRWGTRCWVNSIHHQAIDQLADSLRLLAWSEDGLVEAVESTQPGLDFLGLQFHPECLIQADHKFLAVFEELVQKSMTPKRKTFLSQL